MSDHVIGVLALQGDVREHLTALAECGVIARPVRRPGEIDEIDGLVIPGGESTTMSKLAIAFDVFEPIQKRLAGGMPAYGSCAGMIMLADGVLDGRPDQRSFGGIAMTVRRNAFGRQVDSFEAPVELDGIEGGPLNAVFIRAPWVESVGPAVQVIGRVGQSAASTGRGSEAASTGRGSAADSAGRGSAAVGAGRGSAAGGAGVVVAGDGVRLVGGGAMPERGATSAAGRIVAVRQGHLLATSFHPELTGDLRVHQLFVEMVREG